MSQQLLFLPQHYRNFSPWSWMQIRQLLLAYFHEKRTRVSLFIKQQLQSDAGYFYLDLRRPLPRGIEIPNLIPNDGIRKMPYHFQIKLNLDSSILGSNLFNETKKLQRGEPLPSLDRLFLNDVPEATETVAVNTENNEVAECDMLNILLPINTSGTDDVVRVDCETLVDLFDRVNL